VRYRSLRRLLPVALWTYIALGFAAAAAPGFEVFPFFCWFLFPLTPNVETRYELMVERMGDEAWADPVNYQELDRVEDPHAMDLWVAVQALGAAIERDDEDAVPRARRMLEANFIPGPSRYGVDRVRFDPLVRFRTDEIEDRARIATFTSSTGCTRIPWAYAR
jgi:hypothetical protein